MIDITANPPGHAPDLLEVLFDNQVPSLFDKKGKLIDPDAAANLIGFNYEYDPLGNDFNMSGSDTINDNQILGDNVCQSGTFVIVEVSNIVWISASLAQLKSHFVLVTGKKFDPAIGKCRFTIDDPASANPQGGDFSPKHVFLDEYDRFVSARIFSKQ